VRAPQRLAIFWFPLGLRNILAPNDASYAAITILPLNLWLNCGHPIQLAIATSRIDDYRYTM